MRVTSVLVSKTESGMAILELNRSMGSTFGWSSKISLVSLPRLSVRRAFVYTSLSVILLSVRNSVLGVPPVPTLYPLRDFARKEVEVPG